MPYPKKLTKKNIELILQQIAEGKSLRSICDRDDAMPSWRSFLKHVRENDDVHSLYRRARIDQAETLRDYLLELTQRDLPTDKQFANAEVQRRKLEADVINRMIGSAQNRGLRDRVEDKASDAPAEITIKWGGSDTDDAVENGLSVSTMKDQQSAREKMH